MNIEDIPISNIILDKAQRIIAKKNQEEAELKAERKRKKNYIKTCVHAKICPVCGDELHSRKATKEEKREFNYDYYNDTLECNKFHYKFISGEYENDEYD